MSNENLPAERLAGYRHPRAVGEGGTAEVYRAEHPSAGLRVQGLRHGSRGDPTLVKRFCVKAGIGSRVVHPVWCVLTTTAEADGLHYLALEMGPLGITRQLLHRNGPSLRGCRPLVRQLADALGPRTRPASCTRLKPENIMYDPCTRIVKLLDFGIARDASATGGTAHANGVLRGPLQYVAPEAAVR